MKYNYTFLKKSHGIASTGENDSETLDICETEHRPVIDDEGEEALSLETPDIDPIMEIANKLAEKYKKSVTIAENGLRFNERSQLYIIPKNTQGEKMFPDGYRYKQSVKTSRNLSTIFQGDDYQARLYKCKGRVWCYNQQCPFKNRFSVVFQASNSSKTSMQCSICSGTLLARGCPGSKVILTHEKWDIILYETNHTCPRESVVHSQVLSEVENMFRDNPSLTPSDVFSILFENKLRYDKPEDELESLLTFFSDPQKGKNLKVRVQKELNPIGTDFKSVESLAAEEKKAGRSIIECSENGFVCMQCKTATDSLNCHCRECGKIMQKIGNTVLVTGKELLKISGLIDQNGTGPFKENSVYIDHQPSRIEGWNTLTVNFYDFHIQKLVSIFTFHSKDETAGSVFYAFYQFEKILKQHGCPSFNPYGFSIDAAGALAIGLKLPIGDEVRLRSCQFHILYSAHCHLNSGIGDHDDKVRYLRFVDTMLSRPPPSQYYELFLKWIKSSKSRGKALLGFLA